MPILCPTAATSPACSRFSSHDCMLTGIAAPSIHWSAYRQCGSARFCFGLPTVYHIQPHRWRAAEAVVRPMARWILSWWGRHHFLDGMLLQQANDDEIAHRASWLREGQRPVRGEYTIPFEKDRRHAFEGYSITECSPVSHAAIGLKTLCRVLSAILSPRWKWRASAALKIRKARGYRRKNAA